MAYGVLCVYTLLEGAEKILWVGTGLWLMGPIKGGPQARQRWQRWLTRGVAPGHGPWCPTRRCDRRTPRPGCLTIPRTPALDAAVDGVERYIGLLGHVLHRHTSQPACMHLCIGHAVAHPLPQIHHFGAIAQIMC